VEAVRLAQDRLDSGRQEDRCGTVLPADATKPNGSLITVCIAFEQSNDFSQTPISATFVMHDSRDWGRDVTLICELLSSENGVFGTRRQEKKEMDSDDKNRSSVGSEGEEHMPLVFSNPDLEWQS
jgi:hypothetical protein